MTTANTETDRATEAPASVASTGGFGYFAAPCSDWDDGWWGPAKTREDAIRDMLSNWIDDPLESCVTAVGYEVNPENYPDLFEDGESISPWDYQVERPHETHTLPLPNDQEHTPK